MNESLSPRPIEKPNILIVATYLVDRGFERLFNEGKHHQLDYLELAKELPADFLDYRNTPQLLRPLDDRLRNDLGLAFVVSRQIRANGYSQIFAWSEQIGLPLAMLKKLRLIEPLCELTAMFHFPLLLPRMIAYRATGALDAYDKLIFISRVEAEEFQRRIKVAPEKVFVLHTPHDVDFYRPFAMCENPEEDFVFSIGVAERDYGTLCAALRFLPAIRCTISASSSWDHLSGNYGQGPLPSNLTLRHLSSPVSVRDYSNRMRFLVTPVNRNTDHWTAGCTSATLAGAMGKAIIASDIPGLREYVINGETGILVEPGNPKALAEAIEYLWDNPKIAESMGANGRKKIVGEFSLPIWIEKLKSILTGVLPTNTNTG